MITWREATRTWWDRHRSRYEVVTSDVVLGEVRKAPPPKSRLMEELLADVPRLPQIAKLIETAEFYLQNRLLPADAIPDALHLALASLHSIDFLLTWNIRHLANANKFRHLSVLNIRLGLLVPIITTPELLTPENQP